MNTPRSVTRSAPASDYERDGRRAAAQRGRERRGSPHSFTPRGRIRTKAVGACSGSGRPTSTGRVDDAPTSPSRTADTGAA